MSKQRSQRQGREVGNRAGLKEQNRSGVINGANRQTESPLGTKGPNKSLGQEKQNPEKILGHVPGHQRRGWGLIGPANGGNYKAGNPCNERKSKKPWTCELFPTLRRNVEPWMEGLTDSLKQAPYGGGHPGRNGSKKQEMQCWWSRWVIRSELKLKI